MIDYDRWLEGPATDDMILLAVCPHDDCDLTLEDHPLTADDLPECGWTFDELNTVLLDLQDFDDPDAPYGED